MNGRAPFHYLRPCNGLTYGSLLAGLLAFAAAKDLSSWHVSGGLIALSVLLDTFDGRFARLFRRNDDQSAFGVEFDSLTDAVVFGFVPVACLYLLVDIGTSLASRAGWYAAALAYLVSSLTRLGCYNLHQVRGERFVGVPTTLAALFLTTLFVASPSAAASAFALVVCAVAMSAPVPVPRPRRAGLALFVAWVLLVFAWHAIEGVRELGPIGGFP